MDLGISRKVALVNGGSAGLGRGAALALAREKTELFITARGEEKLHKSCEQMAKETGAKITPIVADHSSDAGREKILSICPEPDILVATCSPPPFTGDFRTVDREDWEKALSLTLLSPVEFIKAVIDGMIERKWGRIVNIATGAAKYPAAMRVLSGPPRSALVNYSVAVAKQVARHGVMINTILPGMHHTDGIRDMFESQAEANGTSYDEEVAQFVKQVRIPVGRFGDAEDMGAFVALFCSEMAGYVTGQSLTIDGGMGNSIF
ncbi:SDR family oxidoreductase [Sphingorhabdus sp. Alg231-15]|uniref:SDR family oxidoreductase n=1 Tax=Sphingorhabdus sp. Alg231-15 TaxID=1922222 RepID=UPI000D54E26D